MSQAIEALQRRTREVLRAMNGPLLALLDRYDPENAPPDKAEIYDHFRVYLGHSGLSFARRPQCTTREEIQTRVHETHHDLASLRDHMFTFQAFDPEMKLFVRQVVQYKDLHEHALKQLGGPIPELTLQLEASSALYAIYGKRYGAFITKLEDAGISPETILEKIKQPTFRAMLFTGGFEEEKTPQELRDFLTMRRDALLAVKQENAALCSDKAAYNAAFDVFLENVDRVIGYCDNCIAGRAVTGTAQGRS